MRRYRDRDHRAFTMQGIEHIGSELHMNESFMRLVHNSAYVIEKV